MFNISSVLSDKTKSWGCIRNVASIAPNKPNTSVILVIILKSCFLSTIENIKRNNENGMRVTGIWTNRGCKVVKRQKCGSVWKKSDNNCIFLIYMNHDNHYIGINSLTLLMLI